MVRGAVGAPLGAAACIIAGVSVIISPLTRAIDTSACAGFLQRGGFTRRRRTVADEMRDGQERRDKKSLPHINIGKCFDGHWAPPVASPLAASSSRRRRHRTAPTCLPRHWARAAWAPPPALVPARAARAALPTAVRAAPPGSRRLPSPLSARASTLGLAPALGGRDARVPRLGRSGCSFFFPVDKPRPAQASPPARWRSRSRPASARP